MEMEKEKRKGKGRGGKKEKRTKARVGTVVRTGKRGVEKRRSSRSKYGKKKEKKKE